jgi:ferredoxin
MPDSQASTGIQRVWIEEGCISCSLCSDICPEVFDVPPGEDCRVKPDAPAHFRSKDEQIREAAADCPVEVIQFSEAPKA